MIQQAANTAVFPRETAVFAGDVFIGISCFKEILSQGQILSQQHVEGAKLGVIAKSFYVSHTCISIYLLSPIFEGPHLCTVVYHK